MPDTHNHFLTYFTKRKVLFSKCFLYSSRFRRKQYFPLLFNYLLPFLSNYFLLFSPSYHFFKLLIPFLSLVNRINYSFISLLLEFTQYMIKSQNLYANIPKQTHFLGFSTRYDTSRIMCPYVYIINK